MKNFFVIFLILLGCLLYLATLKGELGNPSSKYIANNLESAGKSFELSPERNRYSQLLSIIDYHSFTLPLELAKIVVPDLGYANGQYVSIYPPGVTFISLPFYVVGRFFNISQLVTFLVPAMFGLISFILLISICRVLGISQYAACCSALLFLLGTSAWAYSTTLYQHLITTSLLLLAIRLLLTKNSFWISGIMWFIISFSVLVDYPNIFFVFPIMLLLLLKNSHIMHSKKSFHFHLKYFVIFALIFILPTLILNSYYSVKTFNKLFVITQEATPIRKFDKNDNPVITLHKGETKSAFTYLNINNLDKGLNVLTISGDRGLLLYSPVFFLSLFGLNFIFKINKRIGILILSIIITVFLVYGTWFDPWGGWAFGPRYLIPAFGLASIFLAAAIEKYIKNIFFLFIFLLTGIYSIAINALGAVTSNQVPPYHEAVGLGMKYNYLLNLDYLNSGLSGSFVYNYFFKSFINLHIYFTFLYLIAILIFLLLTYKTITYKREGYHES